MNILRITNAEQAKTEITLSNACESVDPRQTPSWVSTAWAVTISSGRFGLQVIPADANCPEAARKSGSPRTTRSRNP
jgi:hypothetical protein